MRMGGYFALMTLVGLVPGAASAGLIGHWKLNETSGTTAADSSSQLHSASLQGNPAWTSSGKAGGALTFDGTGDYLSTTGTETSHLTGGFTISAWVLQTGTSAARIVAGKHETGYQNGWFLSVKNGQVDFYVNGEDGRLSGGPVSDGQWHHLVGVYNGLNQWLYVDNQLVDTGSVTYANTNARPWIIGGAKSSTTNNYNSFLGNIDDVQLYDTALTAENIAYLFNHPGFSLPEPASLTLMASGLMVMLRRR